MVALDAFARFASLGSPDTVFPFIFLMDLLSVFPRVSHEFLFLVLKYIKAPDSVISFIKALYFAVKFFSFNGKYKFAFFAKGCMLQGCPLSASLFVMVMYPFLNHFQQELVSQSYGVIYACADDLGGTLLSITSLFILLKTFDIMQNISCLV